MATAPAWVWDRLPGLARGVRALSRVGAGVGTADRVTALRASGVCHIAPGIGFGVGAVIADQRALREHGELPMTPWGFRAFDGPFVRLGPEGVTALLWYLTGTCALDVVAGTWLWQGRRRGAVLGFATTPVQLGLGAGFLLPFLLGATLSDSASSPSAGATCASSRAMAGESQPSSAGPPAVPWRPIPRPFSSTIWRSWLMPVAKPASLSAR